MPAAPSLRVRACACVCKTLQDPVSHTTATNSLNEQFKPPTPSSAQYYRRFALLPTRRTVPQVPGIFFLHRPNSWFLWVRHAVIHPLWGLTGSSRQRQTALLLQESCCSCGASSSSSPSVHVSSISLIWCTTLICIHTCRLNTFKCVQHICNFV